MLRRPGADDLGDVLARQRGLVVGAGVDHEACGANSAHHVEELWTINWGEVGQRAGRERQARDELLGTIGRRETDRDGPVDVGEEDLGERMRVLLEQQVIQIGRASCRERVLRLV